MFLSNHFLLPPALLPLGSHACLLASDFGPIKEKAAEEEAAGGRERRAPWIISQRRESESLSPVGLAPEEPSANAAFGSVSIGPEEGGRSGDPGLLAAGVVTDNLAAAAVEAPFVRPKTAAHPHPSPLATLSLENMAGSAEAAKNFLESAFNKTKEVVSTAAETTKGYANVAINKIIPGQGQPGTDGAPGQPGAPGAPGSDVNAPGPQPPQ
ncbi:hypothetical protein L596_018552 [Steinernema carpocapsae]|uniref:Nematode cuticle collagen N-terminal domain-containing protein n=1 Tax=Steinernema carpocapsae TaxID=34508 RepID=A0A4U5N593_STECR|nr:hypothetical protein L596_018552 [Steinernema carpocapsae]